MALKNLSSFVLLGMSNLLRNLKKAKANIQIRKTGAEVRFHAEISAASDLER